MLEKLFTILLIIVLVFFIYEIVHNMWTIDICVSYYQRYGNYSFDVPLTDEETNTWDCYHEALNDMMIYVIGIVAISIFLGAIIGTDSIRISVEKKEKKID